VTEDQTGDQPLERDDDERFDRAVEISEWVIGIVEIVAAFVLVALFAIGVFDLTLKIIQRTLSGEITDPLVVVGFIDTALLLFIIVEVYQTVVAYTQESDTREIVQLVAYTGIIAMVRKVIIFRSEVYEFKTDALVVAGSYGLLLLALSVLLWVERTSRE